MKIRFENHWPHNHCILLGVEWLIDSVLGRKIELTVLNFGIEIRWRDADSNPYTTVGVDRAEGLDMSVLYGKIV